VIRFSDRKVESARVRVPERLREAAEMSPETPLGSAVMTLVFTRIESKSPEANNASIPSNDPWAVSRTEAISDVASWTSSAIPRN
jgi:hypothetical protein